jgi:Spy/CpxP family protein refolding chaperone
MKRMMRVMLVLGLLAAGLAVRTVRAEEPVEPPVDLGRMADLGDDPGDLGPMMAPDDMGGGGMGPGRPGPGRGRGGWSMHHGRLGPMLARELDLTPQQIEKMKATRDAQQRKAIQARADIQIARLDLRKLIQADKPDAKAIEVQIDRIAGLRAGLEKSRVAAMLDFRASLTPDQQKKLRELHDRGPEIHGPGAPQKRGGDM